VSKTGIQEKELSALYASSLESALREKGLNVVQTRSQDEFISLLKRVEKAQDGKADAVISIHFNYSK